jgi:hypothetical protein
VLTQSFEDGELIRERLLESMERRDLDPAAFEPPSGYRRTTMALP